MMGSFHHTPAARADKHIVRRRLLSGALERQRGVAVVTALLLTTLAITIVASLFWQQQVQVRAIENQRLQLQRKWVMRGALDWARLILREDARNSNVDYLGEPWAVPLEETRLDQYVENGREDTEASDASLSGHIVDAQSRFNLTNLATNGVVNPPELAMLAKLLTNLQMKPSFAEDIANNVAATQAKPAAVVAAGSASQAGTTQATPSSASQAVATVTPPLGGDTQFMRFSLPDDLLSVPGFTPAMLERIRNFVVVLPRATPINVNTASAEVLSAREDDWSMSDAASVIASRDRAYIRDIADLKQRFPDKMSIRADGDFATTTNFFIVSGRVKLSRSVLDMNALIERTGINTNILWIKEN